MKKTTINKIVSTILLAGVCEIGLVGVAGDDQSDPRE